MIEYMREGVALNPNPLKVMIVSSETLYPDDWFGSIFELHQASVLREVMDVTILAVNPRQRIRSLIKSFFFNPATTYQRIIPALREWTLGCARFTVDQVPVLTGYRNVGATDFYGEVELFCAAALNAFELIPPSCHPDILHAHGRFLFAGEFARRIKQNYGIPYIYTDHSSAYSSGKAPEAARPMLRRLLSDAAVVSAVSSSLSAKLRAFSGLDVLQVEILPNCVAPVFEDNPLPYLSGYGSDIVCIASLIPIKRLDTVLDGFSQAKAAGFTGTLKIAGNGPLRNALEQQAKVLGVSSYVNFLGQRTQLEVLSLLDTARAIVIASESETFCVAALEGLFRGVPVVCSRCGGPEDYLNSGNSLMFDVGDSKALSDCLISLDRFQRFNKQSIRERTVKLFGRHAYRRKVISLYQQSLGCIN